MKKVLGFAMAGWLILGCQSESDVGPAKDETFIKYFGTENNNVAVSVMEVDGGYTLLSYSEVSTSTVGQVNYKLKLTGTDKFGNIIFDRNFPEFVDGDLEQSMIPSAFIRLSDEVNPGYLILGDRINGNTSELQLITFYDKDILNKNVAPTVVTIPAPIPSNVGSYLKGRALMQDASDNFVVLASLVNDTKDMYLAKILADGMTVSWGHKYGDGKSTLASRLYLNSAPNTEDSYIWGGSVSNNIEDESIRLVEVTEDSPVPTYNNNLSPPDTVYHVSDFCKTVGGWAVTGWLLNKDGNKDLFVRKVAELTQVTPLLFTRRTNFESLNDGGASICNATDGGLIVAGTVGTTLKADDLYLAKIDGYGTLEWEHTYGNSDKQEAAKVIPTSDGGYFIFATTYFGNVKKLMLVKVDKGGEF